FTGTFAARASSTSRMPSARQRRRRSRPRGRCRSRIIVRRASAMLPIALTIGGSDPGGGAGIQADLKTFHEFGGYGPSAIVAVPAQNAKEVGAILPLPPEFVAQELALLAEDLPPAAVKSGMLATSELVRAVADAIERHRWSRYVLDPVMVATSGARLLSDQAVQ